MRGVLCLFEGVVAGAADGYARMAAKPAATLLHLGPGFANAVSFLHNAQKARAAIVNIVGDHATTHAQYIQAPLTSDIMGICRPVSHWLHRATDRRTVARRWRARGAGGAGRAGAGGDPGAAGRCRLERSGRPGDSRCRLRRLRKSMRQ